MNETNATAEPVESVVIDGMSALEAIDRAQVDVQISTAKQYPRSIDRFQKECLSWATIDAETAGSMFYTLPRAGKRLEGPSVRLAEVVGATWGNLRVEGDVVEIGERFLTAMGSCFDLERNVAVRTRVKRRITDRQGNRFKDDMIQVASNAAISIAIRNAVFKVVPFAFVKGVYEAARKASLGTGTMEEKRKNAFAWFKKAGVDQKAVLKALDKRGLPDVDEDDLIQLRGLKTAIQEGTTTAQEAFSDASEQDTSEQASALNQAISARQEQEGTSVGAQADKDPVE